MDYHDAIERYYRAYRDRDAMIDDIGPAAGQTRAANLRILGDGPEFVAPLGLTVRILLGRTAGRTNRVAPSP